MKRNVWLIFSLLLILPIMVISVSCTKQSIQDHPSSMSQHDASETSNKVASGDRQAELSTEVPRRADAQAGKNAEMEIMGENVYFAFDSALLSDQAQQTLNGNADYLNTNPNVIVTIEGHCDERGTEAYNMALGEQRAESVKVYLINLGINPYRLNTISFGEEQPVAYGKDEASWSKNRRAHFVNN